MKNSVHHTPGVHARQPRGGGRSLCCLKCWLTLFILMTLALVGVVVWLALAPANQQIDGYAHQPAATNLPDVCYQHEDAGPCYAAHRRYRYEKEQEKCVEFIYGGCEGNANNFETLEKCENMCSASQVDTLKTNSICLLPKVVGRCRASVNRVYFDSTTGQCTEFIYGGCDGNKNNFESIQECEQACPGESPIAADPAKICAQPKESGPCYAMIPRFFFNSATKECVQFNYGGCQGNENNFETAEECKEICIDLGAPSMSVDPSTGDICQLPTETGPCKSSQPRFTYDVLTGKCKEFIYGGCRGNANNFETLAACEQKCVPRESPIAADPAKICAQPKESGPCYAMIPRFFFNSATKECVQFNYGGCQGNENNFETAEECKEICIDLGAPSMSVDPLTGDICQLPTETGPCKSSQPRFTYDVLTGKCKEFIYGGCRGNANNFETLAACEQKCVPPPKDKLPSRCFEPQHIGPCKSIQERFSYNSKGDYCEQFMYGGCQGNGNNFETLWQCERACGIVKLPMNGNAAGFVPEAAPAGPANSPLTGKTCQLPLEAGPCMALKRRFGYDNVKGECVMFNYGGCQGNANNFETKEECEQQCSSDSSTGDICQLPTETGPCKSSQPRFTYDVLTGKCKEFIYGGCRGNANNFETLAACEQKCVPPPKDKLPSRCFEPQHIGPCKSIQERFSYNSKGDYCEQFMYGGCQGNGNNFETLWQCERACGIVNLPTNGAAAGFVPGAIPAGPAISPSSAKTCDLPLDVGPCRASIKRYGFDTIQGACVSFIYGGCQGNANRYETKEECEQQCSPAGNRPSSDKERTGVAVPPNSSSSAACQLPINKGPCRASMPRFGFDVSTRKCVAFIYGGCRGNDNRFETQDACVQTCEGG